MNWGRSMEVEADRLALRDDPRVLQRTTFGDCLRRYRREISSRKRGHDVERWIIGALLRSPLANRSLASLRAGDFAAYRDERLSSVSGSGLNREFAVISHLFEVARTDWAYPLPENPLSRMRRPPNNPPRERRLRDGELGLLLDAADQCRNKLVKPIIILAVETAMRRGEILAIRATDLDLSQKRLQIPRTKTGVARTIPLTTEAARILTAHLTDKDKDGRLFPITANAFRLAWDRVKHRATVQDLHFHDLRHEAISRLFERGLGVAHVAAISGHQNFKMLARYTHVTAPNLD